MSEEQVRPATAGSEAGWGSARVTIACQRCGRAHYVVRDHPPQRCPFCMQGPLQEQQAGAPPAAPEMVLPLSVTPARMRAALAEWTRGLWLRPPDMTAEMLCARAQPVFIPTWLVDARVQGRWRAEIGFDYQAVSFEERYGEGQGWRSRERLETRVRWEPRLGRFERRYENVSVPALDDQRALPAAWQQYDPSRALAATAEVLAGAAVLVPTLAPATAPDPGEGAAPSAWPEAERLLRRAAEADCLRASGGQHIRAFALQARYSDLHWTLLLLPAWVSWYSEGGRVWPVFINGQTGAVSGARCASASAARTVGIVIGVLGLALVLAGMLLAIIGLVVPPVAVVGTVLALVGVAVLILAVLPPLWARAHNRRVLGELPLPLGED